MKKWPVPVVYCCILLTSIVLFWESFSLFFFQDDFFILNISTVHSWSQWFQVFIPRSDIQFYRPLSSETFYLVNHWIFGWRPFWFHISAWLVWSFAVGMVYMNSGWFLTSRRMRYLVTILYATAAIHYNSLFWIANTSYIFSAACFFLGFFLWKKTLAPAREMFLLPLLYLVGLLCSEFLLTLPFLLAVDGLLQDPRRLRRSGKTLVLLFLLTVVYLVARLVFFKPHVGSYQFVVNAAVISSYRWFFLFFLNWAEPAKDYFLTFYRLRTDFIRTFPLEVAGWVVNTFVLISSLLLVPRTLASVLGSRRGLFALFWCAFTLTPIIFVPSHISPHQGSIALFGFVVLVGIVWESSRPFLSRPVHQGFLFLLLLSWLLSSSLTVQFDTRVHWIYRRSELAKHWLAYVRQHYPHPLAGTTIVIPSKEKEVTVALDDGEAIRQLYSDPTLRVVFQP